jgi:transcriptional regulator with XRE-family HTH domain
MADRLRNRLRLWRAQEGLTLEEVGDLTGLSPAMLSRVERGERQLAPLTRVRVARCLGVPVRELFEVVEVADDEAVVS